MKLMPLLALAALTTGAAFAASTPPTATPAASATPATTTTAKHHSAMYCDKQAKEKKLTGDEEKKFVKECRDAKKTH